MKAFSGLISLAFQVLPGHFWPFFRHGFGRRYYSFAGNIIIPLVFLIGAFWVRNDMELRPSNGWESV